MPKVRASRQIRLRATVERLRASLWFVPSVLVVAAAALAGILTSVTVEDGSVLRYVDFPGGAESARAILQAIAGSVITVTGVVFSLTVVTLQLASTQFSPRLLRTFLRDLSNQVVLGVFLATFTYALLVLRAVDTGATPAEDVVPTLGVTGAYFLTAASVVSLVYFIDHIARSIRIDSLMREVNEDTRTVIDHLHPDRFRPAGDPVEPPLHRPPWATPVAAPRSGFVQGVDDGELLRAAVAYDAFLEIEPLIGARVIAGSPLAWTWAASREDPPPAALADAVQDAVQVGYERTLQQDIAFGFRQLVDVAVKALSPGVNDPTTAVHALGHLAALLSVLANRHLGPVVCRDARGDPRVVVRALDFPGYLDLACGQIRRYGAAEPAVTSELLRLLLDVTRCGLPPDHADAVGREADMVMVAARGATVEPRDLEHHHELVAEVRELLARCRVEATDLAS